MKANHVPAHNLPVRVACAIIEAEGRILAARRGAGGGPRAMRWEFPGGKLRAGESAAECAIREIREELNLCVAPICEYEPVFHRYTDMAIMLIPVLCRLCGGEMRCDEHHETRWITAQEGATMDWCEADAVVRRRYLPLESGLSD